MEFILKKEDLLNLIRIVERATAMKGLQPVLANILIETVDKSGIKFCATDLDLTVITIIPAQIISEGKITLPAKTLGDIVSRLSDGLVNFKQTEGTNIVNLTCKNSKFDIIGISASEFPVITDGKEFLEENMIEIALKPFTKAIRQAAFAAAGYESNNLLSGVVCDISENILEMASTDGNRLARVREKIENKGKTAQLIIPARTLQEFIKMSTFIEDETVKIFTDKTKLMIKSDNTVVISRLMEGQYPKYNQLIPQDNAKEAIINIPQLIASLERVAVMVNEKTSIVKFEFKDNKLILTTDTPDSGASEDEIDIDYKYDEELKIAFNYRYVLDSLKNMDSTEVKIGLNTPLSATILKPNNEEDYICLVMPVQIR
ncbi:MAG: DNA polymerase III subunit beta [Candidatus Gastranaerophilales bacterium]|nr:DNA polymerase III subunit beta [Candidatus Gastranaerophilales bacterium]